MYNPIVAIGPARVLGQQKLAREQCEYFRLEKLGKETGTETNAETEKQLLVLVSCKCAHSYQKESRTNGSYGSYGSQSIRFTVLHSIAYEINRICQWLVLTGSNTIDKDYGLPTVWWGHATVRACACPDFLISFQLSPCHSSSVWLTGRMSVIDVCVRTCAVLWLLA